MGAGQGRAKALFSQALTDLIGEAVRDRGLPATERAREAPEGVACVCPVKPRGDRRVSAVSVCCAALTQPRTVVGRRRGHHPWQ